MHSSGATTIHNARDLSPSTFTTTQVSPTNVAEGSLVAGCDGVRLTSPRGRRRNRTELQPRLTVAGDSHNRRYDKEGGGQLLSGVYQRTITRHKHYCFIVYRMLLAKL